ncbi:hypothetical protein GBAR_LOCUS27694 [Geodia barretti]|uniref:Uncharacterized protein n=1 Tax=Geodia barretti TaxID=519541 RepID=A0AA35TP13_GEOBA|nr:hypothetical protein GBAR_LOCUS27694 [Geodia barretti]
MSIKNKDLKSLLTVLISIISPITATASIAPTQLLTRSPKTMLRLSKMALSAAEFTMHLIGRDSTARQSLTTATCLQTAVAISTLTTTASSSNLWAPPSVPLDTSGKRVAWTQLKHL